MSYCNVAQDAPVTPWLYTAYLDSWMAMYVLVRAWVLRVEMMRSISSIFRGRVRWKQIGAKAGQVHPGPPKQQGSNPVFMVLQQEESGRK